MDKFSNRTITYYNLFYYCEVKMKNKIIALIVIGLIILTATGCVLIDSADTVSSNISTEANEFKVKRRITFINLRTGEYLFQAIGNCSVKGGSDSSNDELELICRIGEDKYQKHMLYIANETTYVIEQLEYSDVSRYDYEFIFKPEAIIPIEIKTQVGD